MARTNKPEMIDSADALRAAHAIKAFGTLDLTPAGETALIKRLRATASALANGARIVTPDEEETE